MIRIAIIGASYLQLPLVKKAKEMGLETHCFAWDEGAVCKDFVDFFYPISILEKELILEVCRNKSIDGIVSIASDAAVPTVNFVANELGLISNLYSDALACTNKFEMRKRFIEYTVNCPKFLLSDGNIGHFGLRYPVIIKPVDRSGSRGVTKVYDQDELQAAINRAESESFSGNVIIEEYITGNEVSVETISWEGEHYILAITDKETTGEPYFVELAHHQPSLLPESIINKIKFETIKSLDALSIKYGASHAEFKITNEGEVFAIETGARMGGDFIGSDLVRLSTGFDFVKAVIDVALGKFEAPDILYQKFSGVYFLSAETSRLLSVFESNVDADWLIDKELTEMDLKEIKCSADRSGFIIYQSDHKIVL